MFRLQTLPCRTLSLGPCHAGDFSLAQCPVVKRFTNDTIISGAIANFLSLDLISLFMLTGLKSSYELCEL